MMMGGSCFALKDLPLETKIGQLILVGFNGVSAQDPSISKLQNQIQSGAIGGVILYGKNIESPQQTQALIDSLKQVPAPYPIFVAVDQEGGAVQRLNPDKGFEGWTPSAKTMATTQSIVQANTHYRRMARLLKLMGFNLNFGTVVDLEVKKNSPAIGKRKRSFSPDPYQVSHYAAAMLEAHLDMGIVSVIKHFPGHGSASGDSHTQAVDITYTWSDAELIPYQQLLYDPGVDMIMTAHLKHDDIDPRFPATLSKAHISQLLRQRLGFSGVVITDDLQMAAIHSHFELEESVVLALSAGCDILLFGNQLAYNESLGHHIRRIVLKAIKSGKLSESHIHDAYERVARLKERYIL